MQILFPVFIVGVVGFLGLPQSKRKAFIILYCFVLAIVAFSFQPHSSDDLYREFQNLDGIRQYGWSYFGMKSSQYYESSKFEGLYLTQLYYFIMAQFPVNNFLPAVNTFIVYFLQFSIVEKVSKRYQLSELEIWSLYIFVLCTRETYMIMSGIRNQLAFTIMGYFLYIDLIEKKSRLKCFTAYIAMIFVHQSSAFIFVFRVLCFIKNKKIRISIAAVMLMWSGLLDNINNILQMFPSIPIINSILYKINIYTVNNGGNVNNVTLTFRYLIYMLSWVPIIFLVVLSVILINKNKIVDENIEIMTKTSYFWKKLKQGKLVTKSYPCEVSNFDAHDISWFFIFNICFTIGSYIYYWIYLRSAIMLGVIGIIMSGILFYRFDKLNKDTARRSYMIVLIVSCMMKLFIIMFYMNRNMDFSILGFII